MRETLHNIAAGLHNRLLDNDLDTEGRRWLADHRGRCQACDASFARMERLALALSALERPEPSPGFAQRILAEVRPAPAPFWARWQVAGLLGRAAAAMLLVCAGLAFLVSPSTAGSILDGVGVATLFRGPSLLADTLVAALNVADLVSPLVNVGSVLARTLQAAAATPAVLATLAGSALVSAGALLQLRSILAAPQGRHPFHV